jgi:hypothetical protein
MAQAVVVATNPAEMVAAQKHLLGVAMGKLRECDVEIADAESMIEQCKSGGLRTQSAHRILRRAKQRSLYYEKCVAALDAGYFIVPDMPGDVIAIRTDRDRPTRGENSPGDQSRYLEPTKALAIHEGGMVQPFPSGRIVMRDRKYSDGSVKPARTFRAERLESPDIPVKFLKPLIVQRTTEAMKSGIFDELVCVPGEKTGRRDPFVIGRIMRPWVAAWSQSRYMAFMVAWFFDPADL